MNKLQYNTLNKYKDVLKLVYFNNTYKGITMVGLDELADVYYSITKQKINRNWACRACTFKFLLNVSKLYYTFDASVFEKDKDDEAKNENELQITTTTPAPKPKSKSKTKK